MHQRRYICYYYVQQSQILYMNEPSLFANFSILTFLEMLAIAIHIAE